MLSKEIEKIGFTVYAHELKHLKPQKKLMSALTGSIDMEYYDGGLLSTQIGIEGKEKIYYGDYIDIPLLKTLILKQLEEQGINYKDENKPIHLFLATYFSSAEFNHIHNIWEGSDLRHVTPKIMNASFIGYKVTAKGKGKNKKGWGRKITLRVTLLDIYHFFTDLKMPKDENGNAKGKSLANVAELYGLNAQKMSLEGIDGLTGKYWITHMDRLLEKHPKFFRKYALQDVTVTEELMKKHRDIMFKETGIDLLRAHTNGGIAMSYFRTYKMGEKEAFGNSNGEARKLALLCGHGGVMVALKHGLVYTVYENDFRGFYAHASLNCKLLPRNSTDIKAAGDLKEFLKGYDGWGKVEFHFPDTYEGKQLWPTLPVQEHFPNSTEPSCILFPKNGISYCTLSEVKVALEFGAKIKFHEGFIYTTGTSAWSEFAGEQSEMRDEALKAGKSIEAALHKSMPNAAVGKLLQHKRGKSLASVKAEAEYLRCTMQDILTGEYGILDLTEVKESEKKNGNKKALALLKQILPEHQEHGVGSSWMPEWWVVILGRARAALWWTLNKYSVDPVHLSTDSFHDVQPLTKEVKTPVGVFPIEVKSSNAGDDFFSSRTKCNVHSNKIIHTPESITEEKEKGLYGGAVIQHGLHCDRITGGKLIMAEEKEKYTKTGKLTAMQAIKLGRQFADEYTKEMTFSPLFDYKVKMVAENKYVAWENIAEYFKFKKEVLKEEGATAY